MTAPMVRPEDCCSGRPRCWRSAPSGTSQCRASKCHSCTCCSRSDLWGHLRSSSPNPRGCADRPVRRGHQRDPETARGADRRAPRARQPGADDRARPTASPCTGAAAWWRQVGASSSRSRRRWPAHHVRPPLSGVRDQLTQRMPNGSAMKRSSSTTNRSGEATDPTVSSSRTSDRPGCQRHLHSRRRSRGDPARSWKGSAPDLRTPSQLNGRKAMTAELVRHFAGGADPEFYIDGEWSDSSGPGLLQRQPRPPCETTYGHAVGPDRCDPLGVDRDRTSWKVPTWRVPSRPASGCAGDIDEIGSE